MLALFSNSALVLSDPLLQLILSLHLLSVSLLLRLLSLNLALQVLEEVVNLSLALIVLLLD